jgi:hypothetical protein
MLKERWDLDSWGPTAYEKGKGPCMRYKDKGEQLFGDNEKRAVTVIGIVENCRHGRCDMCPLGEIRRNGHDCRHWNEVMTYLSETPSTE